MFVVETRFFTPILNTPNEQGFFEDHIPQHSPDGDRKVIWGQQMLARCWGSFIEACAESGIETSQ
jgi:hypothetical protein